MRTFSSMSTDFFYLLPFLRYKGPKRAKMRFLWPHQIFIFHPILMGFFSLNSSQRELSELLQPIIFYLLLFLRYKGPKRVKMWFLRPHEIFIFHPILMGFFSLDSSKWELSELLQPIFSISYRFRDKRGPKGQKHDFLRPHQIFIFHPIMMGFFSLDSSQWELSEMLQLIFFISYLFRDTRGPKGNVNLLNISL